MFSIERTCFFIILLLGFLFNFNIRKAEAREEAARLIFVSDFVRHGDRAPLTYLETRSIRYPLAWKGLEAGGLTGRGLLREKEVGAHCRKTLIEETRLLPLHYDNRKVCVCSSSWDRTVLSAMAIVLGLYPLEHSSADPLKIYKIPIKQDLLLLPFEAKAKAYHQLLKRAVFEMPAWEDGFKPIKKNFRRWSCLSGYSIHDLNSLLKLIDNVISLKAYCDGDLLCVTQWTGFATNDLLTLLKWKDWAAYTVFSKPEIAEFIACNPVSRIIHDMGLALKDSRHFSYIVYSAHDTNLLGILSYLGYPLDHSPPFGALLRFSLYKIGRKGGEVRVDYFDSIEGPGRSIYRGSLKDFSRHYYNNACFQAIRPLSLCSLQEVSYLSRLHLRVLPRRKGSQNNSL